MTCCDASLNRSQTNVLADALERLVQTDGSGERVAARLELKRHIVYGVLRRRASMKISRQSLERLAGALEIDIRDWDVATTEW